jgi:ribosomal protein S18 acetylase RimI-like enzyme
MIRHATKNDLDRMMEIDKEAYDKYGASKEYFFKKMSSFPKGVLVIENKGKVTGFIVFEIMKKDDIPENFCDMKLIKSMKGKWMYNIVFTTATNYKDKASDSKLLLAAEKIAKDEGCTEACVPLSKEHPYHKNGVFEFYEMNGYKSIGEIKWTPNSIEFIECYFYRKILV